MDDEFSQLLKRKEYNTKSVNKFFEKFGAKRSNEKICHNCGKEQAGKLMKKIYCNFCMLPVCCKECLAKDSFIIPRDFNLNFDLQPKSLCTLAAMFL